MGNLRTALATIGTLSLAACGGAEATDRNDAPVKAELAKMEAVVETTKITRKQCIALLPDKEQLKACMVELSAQNKAEIALIDKATETEKATGQQLDTTIEALSKEVEVLEKVVALQEEPTR